MKFFTHSYQLQAFISVKFDYSQIKINRNHGVMLQYGYVIVNQLIVKTADLFGKNLLLLPNRSNHVNGRLSGKENCVGGKTQFEELVKSIFCFEVWEAPQQHFTFAEKNWNNNIRKYAIFVTSCYFIKGVCCTKYKC